MPYLRLFLCLISALPLWHRALTAQAKPDTSSETIPQLGGPWRLRGLRAVVPKPPDVVMFIQTGNKLRLELPAYLFCGRNWVEVRFILEGQVDGNSVWLLVAEVRQMNGSIRSELAGTCSQNPEYGSLTESTHFRGKLSADGKKIVGPYDESGDRTHVWTFER